MTTLLISTAHRKARNQASIDLADAKAAPARLRLYDARGGTLLAVSLLGRPCATLTSQGRIALQTGAAQSQVLATGDVAWAEWCDGDDVPIASGAVTDEAGAGPFVIEGTVGTRIIQGGLVPLGSAAVLG